MATLGRTPSQTVGPYYSMRLARPGENELAPGADPAKIRIFGQVYDGAGDPMEDALLEVWQANAHGRYRHPGDHRIDAPLVPGFSGFGRASVDLDSRSYWFHTVRPGRVPAPDGSLQAPHLSVILQGRGMLRPLFTRIYFPDEEAANSEDFVLVRVPEARRSTLVAERSTAGAAEFRFDIRLQGPRETVFFAFSPETAR